MRRDRRSFNPCSRGCFARSPAPLPSRETSDGFNPCSRGCFARSPHLCRAERPAMVSILVLVDVSPEVRRTELNSGLLWGFNPCSRGCFARSLRVVVIPDHDTQFQSLFSWMFRPKYPRIAISCLFCGFNPCSRGCFARRQVSCRSLGHLHVSILVLVDVSPEACQMTWPGSFPWCFNPCSRGCFARRGVFLAEGPHPGWFQSLFSWMFRPK